MKTNSEIAPTLSRRQLVQASIVVFSLGSAGILGNLLAPKQASAEETSHPETGLSAEDAIMSDLTNEELAKQGIEVRAAVDGWWGMDTTRMLQQHYGLWWGQGNVNHQWAENVQANSALTSGWYCDYTAIGDDMIRKLQADLGTAVDGIFGGPDIWALQARCGTYQDGVLTGPSPCVMEMQRRLNNGTW